jgi:hypothetical protein
MNHRRLMDFNARRAHLVNAVFPNPFSSNVAMVVLRSGDSEAGRRRPKRGMCSKIIDGFSGRRRAG